MTTTTSDLFDMPTPELIQVYGPMTDGPGFDQLVRDMAGDYNAEYPEAADVIAAATVTLRVVGTSVENGRTHRLHAEVGLRGTDGCWVGISSESIDCRNVRRRDGREAPQDVAARVHAATIAEARRLGIAVEITRGR